MQTIGCHWCWERLIPRLSAAGHAAYGQYLTGLGDRAHLLTPQVGLGTHIDDFVRLVHESDARDVILVGHSYGGMVMTGIADRVSGRMAKLVYPDPFVPRNGESMADIVPRVIARSAERRASRGMAGGGAAQQDPVRRPLPLPRDRGVEHELGALHADGPIPEDIRGASSRGGPGYRFIVSPDPHLAHRGGPFFALVRRLATPRTLPPKEQGWRLRRLPTGHDVMITMPKQLTALLLELSTRRRPVLGSVPPGTR